MPTTEVGRPRARLVLAGSGTSEATVHVIFQSKATRVSRAVIILAVTLAVMPVLFFIPPHFLWPLIALAIGLYMARRYWKGQYYVIEFTGRCPRCGTDVELARGTRIQRRQPLECYGCHRQPELVLDELDE